MKNSILCAITLAVSLLLPSCCGKKCSSKKTAETVEKEIEVQTANILKMSAKEPAELEMNSEEDAVAAVTELEIDVDSVEITERK